MPLRQPDDDGEHIALIRQLWLELQATRKDSVKYRDLTKRIREEADLLKSSNLPREEPKP